MGFDEVSEVAKNVAAIAGCIVALVAVYRMPMVNSTLRRLVRYLFTGPISAWAQKQVRVVVAPQIAEAVAARDAQQAALAAQVTTHLTEASERQDRLHQESVAWLAESQARAGGEISRLCEQLTDDGKRLAAIESRTRQLLPNGGKSIYDRINRMELAMGAGPPVPPTAAEMLATGPVEIHGTIQEVPALGPGDPED